MEDLRTIEGLTADDDDDDDDDDGGATPSYALPTRRRERSREPAPREHVPAKPTRPASPTRTRPHVPARPKPVDDDS
jgi:hypothetical protein